MNNIFSIANIVICNYNYNYIYQNNLYFIDNFVEKKWIFYLNANKNLGVTSELSLRDRLEEFEFSS